MLMVLVVEEVEVVVPEVVVPDDDGDMVEVWRHLMEVDGKRNNCW